MAKRGIELKTLLNFYKLSKEESDWGRSFELILAEHYFDTKERRLRFSFLESILCRPSPLFSKLETLKSGASIPYCSEKWVIDIKVKRYK